MKIEKGIPMPTTSTESPTAIIRSMDVGDSVVIPRSKVPSFITCAKAIGCSAKQQAISATESRVWLKSKAPATK